jgi:hypothetical protein
MRLSERLVTLKETTRGFFVVPAMYCCALHIEVNTSVELTRCAGNSHMVIESSDGVIERLSTVGVGGRDELR